MIKFLRKAYFNVKLAYYRRYVFTKRNIKKEIIEALRHAAMCAFVLWPTYWEFFSRDCDCCESCRYVKIWGYWNASREIRNSAKESEGVFYASPISKKEYKKAVDFSRDRVAEAFDNGSYYFV